MARDLASATKNLVRAAQREAMTSITARLAARLEELQRALGAATAATEALAKGFSEEAGSNGRSTERKSRRGARRTLAGRSKNGNGTSISSLVRESVMGVPEGRITGEIIESVRAKRPEVAPRTIHGEILRMLKKKLLAREGSRGKYRYKLGNPS